MLNNAAIRSQQDFKTAHVYLCSFNEDEHYHVHWHVVPRTDSIPVDNRGPALLLNGDQPTDEKDALRRSLVVWTTHIFLNGIRKLSPYDYFVTIVSGLLGKLPWLKKRALAQAWAGDIYVLSNFPLLVASNLLIGYYGSIVDVILSCLVGLRLLDIVTTQLRIIILDPLRPWPGVISVPRSILLALLNVLQVILIFSVLDHALQKLQGNAFVDQSFQDPGQKFHLIHTSGGFFYLSWTTLLTLGSSYIATTPSAKGLIMAEVACGLPLLVVALGAFVSATTIRQSK